MSNVVICPKSQTVQNDERQTYRIERLADDFFVNEKVLREYIADKQIQLDSNGSIDGKYLQTVLAFIEQQDNRIDAALENDESIIEFDRSRIKICRDDAIRFLKRLPSGCIDVIVTDPAYSGMNNKLKLGHGRIVGRYVDKGEADGKWFREFVDSEENYANFLTECRRVLKRSTGHLYIMFDSFSLLTLGPIVRSFFDVKNLITWDKVNMGMGHYYRRRHEYIIFATNGNNRKIRNRKFPDIWRFKRIYRAAYPTQKPVELFQTMIYASADKNFVICDPFMGSGSAAIAAIKNDCRFVGCDVSSKAIEISSMRIREFLETGKDPIQQKSMAVEDKVFWS